MKSLSVLLAFAALAATSAFAQMNQPMVGENPTKISDHVWAIMGFPNIAIVVGSRATLVVDTGLGPKNGATAAGVAAKLAPNNQKLFLTTTHFHPEHAAGEPGFPPGTILIRDAVQQGEMEKHGQEMIEMFSKFSPQNKELLAGVALRPPDVLFEREATIDLGGVTARLLWFGGAHTKGDELTLV
jgi:glyoxylase-like metal-dependent hydrolase (beta-lactamase superfamily II)